MKAQVRAIAFLFIACLGQASAQKAFSLNLGGPSNVESIKSSIVFSGGGVSATARAYSINRTDPNWVFTNSNVVQWSPGLGVQNSSETSDPMDLVPRYIDNEGSYDFILFIFDRKVDVTSFTVTPSGKNFDTDVTYLFGNVSQSLNLNGVSAGNLSSAGFGSAVSNDTPISNLSRNIATSSPTGGVNALLVGARVGGDTDFDRFKLSVINGNAVPEPSSTMLLGAGLALLVSVRRR